MALYSVTIEFDQVEASTPQEAAEAAVLLIEESQFVLADVYLEGESKVTVCTVDRTGE